ncbi:MAG TPA: hypothetical protein VH575_14435 [Gemmataceae bacterium]|jgi:hypothetical protein
MPRALKFQPRTWTTLMDGAAFKVGVKDAINSHRRRQSESEGEPYSAREIDCAVATIIAAAVLGADFLERRGMLLRLVMALTGEGCFAPAGPDDPL